MPTVYCYTNGAKDLSHVQAMEAQLQDYGVAASDIVRVADASELKKALGKDKIATLIVPNQETLQMGRGLKESVDNVRSAVSNGWNYFGFGGGANLGCGSFNFGKQDKQVLAQNWADYLPFFKLLPTVVAEYPVFHGDKARYTEIERTINVNDGKESFSVYWKEGSCFEFSESPTKDLVPVAYYGSKTTEKIAALQGKCGKGNVFICAFDPHMDPASIQVKGKKEKDDQKNSETESSSKKDASKPPRIRFLHKAFEANGINPEINV